MTAWTPTRPQVVAGALAACAGVCACAAVGVGTAHTDITLEVDGVSRPMVVWNADVATALAQENVTLGIHDRVQPAQNYTLRDGDTVVVRTARPYSLTVDGQRHTVWSTAPSAQQVLQDAPSGERVVLTADRSTSRATLTPLVSQVQSVVLRAGGQERNITVRPGLDARALLAREGIAVSPLDRVEVTSHNGGLAVEVRQVTRSLGHQMVPVPFEEKTEESDQLFTGESLVTTRGVEGQAEEVVWVENLEGQETHRAPASSRRVTEPVTQIRSTGTKDVTPQALIAAGLDPKATLEEGTESDGTTSIRYRARLGTLSSVAEITEIAGGASPEVAAAIMAANIPLTYSGEDPRTLAQPLVAERGWPTSEYQCLVALWNRESHWNPYAANSSGAYGIPQALPGSKMSSAGSDWLTNPVTQIKWGLGYISGRYGTPCSALAHSNSVGWY